MSLRIASSGLLKTHVPSAISTPPGKAVQGRFFVRRRFGRIRSRLVLRVAVRVVSVATVGVEGWQAASVLPQPDWRWVQTIDLGSGDYAQKEAELLGWLRENGPPGPCIAQLGLVCVRGGEVDLAATAQLHAAVYEEIGPRMRGLGLHFQLPDLCDVPGLLPTPSQAPSLECLYLWVSPSPNRVGQAEGRVTMYMLEGLNQLDTLKELTLWGPHLEFPIERLLLNLPPKLACLTIHLVARRHGSNVAPQHIGPLGGEGGEGGTLCLLPRLSSLAQLHLRGVDLTGGDAWRWLHSLASLEVLDLSNCPVDELPPLPALRSVRLRDSLPPGSTQALPKGVGALQSLETLTVMMNCHTAPRDVRLSGLPRLQRLEVNGATLSIPPADLATCTALTRLQLRCSLPEGWTYDVSGMPYLASLTVSHRLPRGLETLSQLTRLKLRDVDLWNPRNLGESLGDLGEDHGAAASQDGAPGVPALGPATVQGEAAQRGAQHAAQHAQHAEGPSPKHLPALPSLKDLYLMNSPLPELPPGLTSLTQLSVHGRKALVPALLPLPALQSLSLTSCGLEALPEGLEALSGTLTALDLSGNPKLPKQLPQLPALKNLHLSDCGVEQLPEGLAALTGLTRLDLNSNEALHAKLPPLPNLRHLSLEDCALHSLPEGLTSLTALRSLDLRGNFHIEASEEEAAWVVEQLGVDGVEWGGDVGYLGAPARELASSE